MLQQHFQTFPTTCKHALSWSYDTHCHDHMILMTVSMLCSHSTIYEKFHLSKLQHHPLINSSPVTKSCTKPKFNICIINHIAQLYQYPWFKHKAFLLRPPASTMKNSSSSIILFQINSDKLQLMLRLYSRRGYETPWYGGLFPEKNTSGILYSDTNPYSVIS